MGFRNVIITKHCKLSFSAQRLLVQSNDDTALILLKDINLILVDTLQAVITTELIAEANRHHIKIIFIDDHHQPVSQLLSCNYYGKYISNLRTQMQWTADKKQFLWTRVIMAKINSQIQALTVLNQDTSSFVDDIQQVQFNDATNREAVVAKKYFPILFNTLDFNRRDSTNQVNSILNYGYSILLAYFDRVIVSHGYLTELGIHHRNDANLFNFGSDLMEPFRPVIDLWVANHNDLDLTPDVKHTLVGLLTCHIQYNDKLMLVSDAIELMVNDCLRYLSGTIDSVTIKVVLTNEVSDYAIDDYV